MPKNLPCPECSAPYGDPHKKTCSKARASRSRVPAEKHPREAPKPHSRTDPCPPHRPRKIRENQNGTAQYQCSRCQQFLGSW